LASAEAAKSLTEERIETLKTAYRVAKDAVD
jgi:hypothetical protein